MTALAIDDIQRRIQKYGGHRVSECPESPPTYEEVFAALLNDVSQLSYSLLQAETTIEDLEHRLYVLEQEK